MHPNVADAHDQILSRGYAKVALGVQGTRPLASALRSAASFFGLPSHTKSGCSTADFNHGYRPLGMEFSVSADRPDLNECFTLWSDREDLIPNAPDATELIRALGAWRTTTAPFIGKLIDALAQSFGSRSGPAFQRASYLQVNRYATDTTGRDLLQDRHEDGHLLTLHHATAPGLEIFVDGSPCSMETGASEVLVMPGSVLTDLTQGAIPPLFHQVRNLGLASRSALMYFVNPELDEPLYAWGAAQSEAVDLREKVRSNPGMFGLPEVPVL